MTEKTAGEVTDYTMVLPVRYYRVTAATAAVESPFAEHLRMLRERTRRLASRLVVMAPEMPPSAYGAVASGLATIEESEGIVFRSAVAGDGSLSTRGRVTHYLRLIPGLWQQAAASVCVHSGLSWDIWNPFEFTSIVFAVLRGKRTVFVVDIDYRNSASMNYQTGKWSRKTYLVCRYFYDPLRSLQVWFASRFCSLVLLKGRKLAGDFGRGRANVKYFVDASHGEKNLIDAASQAKKLAAIRERSEPLRLIYFGRLTGYKGVDRCLHAVSAARKRGAHVTLDIVGGGEHAKSLQELSQQLGADEFVRFHGVRKFDQQFFELLYGFHVLLAAPLSEDTPRSALDGMAAGIPFLAFNTYYYQELSESGAGRVVPWPEVEAMTQALVEMEADREKVAEMSQRAADFARLNTQEIWLERRFEWTLGNLAVKPVR